MKNLILVTRDVCGISPGWLAENGFSAVISDLDNTLAGYGDCAPCERIEAWIKSLEEKGIPLMVLSNAKEKRVAAFCSPLGLPWMAKAGKPGARGLLAALDLLKTAPENVLMVGDQVFTDIWAAKNAGVRAVLVDPFKKGFWFSLRRALEMPFIWRFRHKWQV